MAATLNAFLTLPSSRAFSSFRSNSIVEETGSDSPPRKTPRLAADSDSASASRSRTSVNDGRTKESRGPLVLTLNGSAIKPHPDSFYDPYFRIVKGTIIALLDVNAYVEPPRTYEAVYTACRAVVCEAGKGEGLYEQLKINVEQYIGRMSTQLLSNSSSPIKWLSAFIDASEQLEKRVSLLASLLTYLDQVYVANQKGLVPVRTLVYDMFNRRISMDGDITDKVSAGIEFWSKAERNDADHTHRPVIVKLIRRLTHHLQYVRMFEAPYLKMTRAFYRAESEDLRQLLSPKDFLVRCGVRQDEEHERNRAVIPGNSWSAIQDAVQRSQISDKLDWVADEVVPEFMKSRSQDGLKGLYRFFSAVDGLKVLLKAFKTRVEISVKDIVKVGGDEDNMVKNLLEFKKFCDRLCADVFVDVGVAPQVDPHKASTSAEVEPMPGTTPSKDFSYALVDAFAKGFKSRRNKPAELIAKYLDKSMRKGQQGRDDKSYSAELDAALTLYRFTDDKDVFRRFYHRALAKRLLLEKSASDDHEKAMLKKLKEQYDPDFGVADQMFTDLQLSRDLMKEYKEPRSSQQADTSSHKLTAMVLQRSVWPFPGQPQNDALPEWMAEELQSYLNFYKGKHSGHKLDWHHELGTATIQGRFKNGEKELSVSLFQAIVLLLFNEADQIPFREIQMLTQIDDKELRRTLQSLACGKKRVLKKQPVGKDVNDDDVFIFNNEFTDPAFRVHINSIQVKETAEETKRTQTLIESDRKMALDAAIVRVMKGRKQLHYEQLKTATIEAVKSHFKPEISLIKQRIDSLVEQEYLKREDGDMNMLVYVA